MGEYIIYRARFHALSILCCLIAINAFIWVALASLIQEASKFYARGKSLFKSCYSSPTVANL